ncbi:MAG: hypothetical protein V1794_09500 [Candidatus Glassbacteria bacterium]
MRKLISVTALFTLLVVGCGPVLSLHPLYTDEDVIFNPALVGSWGEAGDSGGWIFKKAEDNVYSVTLLDIGSSGGDSLSLEGHLIQLNGYMFMDVTSKESAVENALVVPVHAFLRLSLEGDSLGIAYMDDSWLQETIEQNKEQIKHEQMNGSGILLTASPKELQQLVLKYAEDEKAFDLEYGHRRN